MREDFLHFVWKSQKIQKNNLTTSSKETVEILNPGQHNMSSGPDFFNARICIDDQEWAGNLEIHLKSSDWYAHGHEKDINYDNVILHVVWEDDVDVFRKDGSAIPTLPLKNYVSDTLQTSYRQLVQNKKKRFINCEKDFTQVDDMVRYQWQERLLVERLEQKSLLVDSLLLKTKNDWETVLFQLLMKTFGLNKNGQAFLALAEHIDGVYPKKVSKSPLQAESLFYGLLGLLDEETILDEYYLELKREFRFLQNKFQLNEYLGAKPVFFGLRPPNFPTIRLSQLANIYGKSPNLFSSLMDAQTIEDFFEIFEIGASSYWDTHFTFGKKSKRSRKTLTKNFIHLILINAIVPLKFCYDRFLGRNRMNGLMDLMDTLPAEKNHITDGFETIGVSSESALESQAKIQLYNEYCKENKCLQCWIGANLLGRKS